MDPGSSSQNPQASGSSGREAGAFQVNDSMYVLHKPLGTPSMQVLFFHGLQLVEDYSKAHLSTWQSYDGSCIWPQKWLVEEFPGAEIVSMSYSVWMGKNATENVDMYNLGENLISDLLQEGIGQTRHCPVILVGHSIGGLFIKQLCCHAHDRLHKKQGIEKDRLEAFLENIRGIFFYATPHHGSLATEPLAHIIGGPLLKYVETLSTDTERLNGDFEDTNRVYKWQLAGLGESVRTKLGPSLSVTITPEASARYENFNIVENADHISICRPMNKISRSFRKLQHFLADIANKMKEEVKIFEDNRAKEEAKAGHQCQGLPDYPVELETRVQDVLKKLRGGAVLGIFGMGGIGKTTLAKQVFNNISKDFEYTCFVDNIKGIKPHKLEDWLLTHFSWSGMKSDRVQWSNLKDTKTLVVIDDIDSEEQLKFLPKFQHFGKSSCLIMTSRNKEVFNFYQDWIAHEVSFLDEEDSKKLFCQYAFRSTEVPNNLGESVEKVVRKCGGLPLTLEVMGRYLRDHTTDTKVWEQTIDRLGKAQSITGGRNDRVWASLKVSYDALAKEEQEMFLEAATLFSGEALDRALAGWSSITGNAETTWRNLVNRSLVREIDHAEDDVEDHPEWTWVERRIESKSIWVHEQLRDLAHNISPGARVWNWNEDTDLLVDQLNRNMVEVQPISLCLFGLSSAYDTRKILQLDKLPTRLKYMELEGISCEGQGNLSILSSIGYYKPPLSVQAQSVTPDYCNGRPRDSLQIRLDEMKNLAVLQLKRFVVSTKFPAALGNLTNLRILVLENLEGLDGLPENFGNLSLLKRLAVTGLRSLILPESLGNLKALEQLAFRNIGSLQFPESLGDLSSLVTLRIRNCPTLQVLPQSLGHLTSLKDFSIDQCLQLECLPQSFGRLSKLRRLSIREDLSYAYFFTSSLGALPASFGLLCALEELTLIVDNLQTLPDNFCHLTRLVKLKMSCCELDTLPENFYLLESLRELTIHCPKLERLPERLGELSLLEVLELLVVTTKALPASVGKLSSLRFLTFTSTVAELLPESLGQLSSLKTLELNCDSLETLPESLHELSSLEELSISATKLECLPECIGHLQSLRRLTLNLRSVMSLPESIGQSLSLREFEIVCSGHEQTSNLFENLSSFAHALVLRGDMTKLPAGLGSLSSLKDLTLQSFGDFQRSEELVELRSLERLTIRECYFTGLPEMFGGTSSLQELRLVGLWWLKMLPEELGELRSLERLSIERCGGLESLPESLGRISSLREVRLCCCLQLKSLPESLGKLSLPELALPQGDKESSQTKGTDRMQLCIAECESIDNSVLESLGWTFMYEGHGVHGVERYYQRQRTR